MIDAGDRYGKTPLFYAAMNGHEAVVNILLDAGANIETRDKRYGWSPLLYAIRNANDNVLWQLLDRGAAIDVTPLWWAIDHGKPALAMKLATRGANVNVVNDKCVAPLIQALRIGPETLAIALIAFEAKIETPLMLASGRRHISVVHALLQKGADVNFVNSVGQTALFVAIKGGDMDIVRLLLEHGADVNTTDRHGKTLFSIAAENGYAEVTDLLHRYSHHSAKPSKQDKTARMPIRTKSTMEMRLR
ncbi:hypothetical protein FQN52_004982 [Onygenales sp. PD_12]|nr:hypothetical protein FQN52_004982 [Onygenales sp. PD_12]